MSDAGFGQYGKTFQEKIMQALLSDPKWAEQLVEVFDVSYFDLKYLVYLAEKYFAYAKKYRVFPTLQLLVTIIKDDLKKGNDVILRDKIINYLKRVRTNPNPNDLQYVKDKALDFCRKQALKGALEQAVDHIAASKYEQIVDIVKKAVSVGTVESLGHDFFKDHDARFERIKRLCVPTGLQELDRKGIFGGGLGQGELGVVVAPTGVGKSHMLVSLGAAAIKAGINVVHYTFELSEENVGIRYDSHLCHIDANDVIDNKEKVVGTYEDRNNWGELRIKVYPTNSASIYTLRAHTERLALHGFRPGLIIIDYADIMRSTRQYDSLRHELKLVYEELRGWSVEMGIPLWTASQSNKEGSTSEIVDLGNMSEAYGKAMVADVVLSISRRAHEKAAGWGRLYIAKNRAGRDGIIFTTQIDTAQSRFKIVGDGGQVTETGGDDEKQVKLALAKRMRELSKDKVLKPQQLNESTNSSDDDKSSDDSE